MTHDMDQLPLDDRRRELERRLASHRRKIEETLPPRPAGNTALARVDHTFPRSKLMQLLLSEHVIVAAVSAIAATLMKRRAGGLLPAAFAIYKFFRKPAQRADSLLSGA